MRAPGITDRTEQFVEAEVVDISRVGPVLGVEGSVLPSLALAGELAPDARGLLPGSPAITRTGRSPASSTQHADRPVDTPDLGRNSLKTSGRTMGSFYEERWALA